VSHLNQHALIEKQKNTDGSNEQVKSNYSFKGFDAAKEKK
jgi:hypothetical protein